MYYTYNYIYVCVHLTKADRYIMEEEYERIKKTNTKEMINKVLKYTSTGGDEERATRKKKEETDKKKQTKRSNREKRINCVLCVRI